MTTLSHPDTPFRLHLLLRNGIAAGSVALALLAVVACARWPTRWLGAIGIACTLFFALKLATLAGHWRLASRPRLLGYLGLWPGMNAGTFLRREEPLPPVPSLAELAVALGKLAIGLALAAWTIAHAFAWPPFWVGAVGVLSALFTFHFGLFHALSWLWRRGGVAAPPLMHGPLGACSLADFWGARWNSAFATLARRFLLRPLARPIGAPAAGFVVFLASGVVHDLAISLPAGGGWGGPTLYFLIEAAGLAAEKSRLGRRAGLGAGVRGWLWTMTFTALPLPLLFHAPLLERVVAPLFRFLKEAL